MPERHNLVVGGAGFGAGRPAPNSTKPAPIGDRAREDRTQPAPNWNGRPLAPGVAAIGEQVANALVHLEASLPQVFATSEAEARAIRERAADVTIARLRETHPEATEQQLALIRAAMLGRAAQE